MKKIDFEAHFYTQEYLDALSNNRYYPILKKNEETPNRLLQYNPEVKQPFPDILIKSLMDMSDGRLAKMDDCGIDVQVLSLSAPGIEQLDPESGKTLARTSNNTLASVIKKHPERFMGYAALAPKDPKEAAKELERAVKDLGFVGWNTHSNYGDSYLDHQRYWPILEKAEKLEIPIYLHPTVPAIQQVGDYGFVLAGPPFGFGMETAMVIMRLIYSGVFDKYPGLKFILGHLGEGLPFHLKRMDWAWVRPFDPAERPNLSKKPGEYIKEHVFVTTSGNYYEPAFMCTKEAFGIDRILLGTDYPYECMKEGMEFVEGLPISKEEKVKIYHDNAKQFGIE